MDSLEQGYLRISFMNFFPVGLQGVPEFPPVMYGEFHIEVFIYREIHEVLELAKEVFSL